MWVEIANFLIEYIVYIVGAGIQILFILLPINLKNWDDDAINICTYVCIQGLAAGIIFIIAPWVLETRDVPLWTLSFMLGGVMILAGFRAMALIPLEFTYPVLSSVIPYPEISFQSFLTEDRLEELIDNDFSTEEGDARYNLFREHLQRVRVTREYNTTTILERLIEEEAQAQHR